MTSTGQWPHGAQGGTTKDFPPGRAEWQEEENEVGLGSSLCEEGTDLWHRRARLEGGSQNPKAPCGAQSAATAATVPCVLPAGCRPHPDAAISSTVLDLG